MNKRDLQQISDLFRERFNEIWTIHLDPVLSNILGRVESLEGRVGNLEGKIGNLEGTVGNLPTKQYIDDKISDLKVEFRKTYVRK